MFLLQSGLQRQAFQKVSLPLHHSQAEALNPSPHLSPFYQSCSWIPNCSPLNGTLLYQIAASELAEHRHPPLVVLSKIALFCMLSEWTVHFLIRTFEADNWTICFQDQTSSIYLPRRSQKCSSFHLFPLLVGGGFFRCTLFIRKR